VSVRLSDIPAVVTARNVSKTSALSLGGYQVLPMGQLITLKLGNMVEYVRMAVWASLCACRDNGLVVLDEAAPAAPAAPVAPAAPAAPAAPETPPPPPPADPLEVDDL